MACAASLNARRVTGRLPHCGLWMLRLPQPQKSFHLRQTSFLVQLLERRVPCLIERLGHRFAFPLGCRCACLGCVALNAGGVGYFSGRLFSGVGGFAFPILAGHRELPRHTFGGFPFDPRPFGFQRLTCLPGSLGLRSDLPVAFDLLWRIRPATRSGFPELSHLPELLGSILRTHNLAYLRQSFPRPVRASQLVRPDQFQLLGCQRLTELYSAQRVVTRNDHVLEFFAEITGHVSKVFADFVRNLLPGHRLPTRASNQTGIESIPILS